MSKDEANTILNTARAGGLIPERYITEALAVTGDLGPLRSHIEPEPEPEIEFPYIWESA